MLPIAVVGIVYLIAYWHRFLFGRVPLTFDTFRFFYPSWAIGQRLSHAGNLLWDPYRNMGQPFLASPESQALYPVRWLQLWLPYFHATCLSVAVHTLLAGVFSYLYFKRKYRSDLAGYFGVFAIAFNGFFLSRVGYSTEFSTMAWAPALLYFMDTRRPLLLGAALAVQWTAGFPPFFVLTLIILGFMALIDNDRGPLLICLSKGGIVALGLAAIQWLPFLEMLKLSARSLIHAVHDPVGNVAPSELALQLLMPSFLIPTVAGNHLVEQFYVGPFLSGLFIWAIVKGGRRERWLGGGSLFFFLLSTGFRSALFRYPAHFLFAAIFLLVPLSVYAFEKIPRPNIKKSLLALIAIDFLIYAWPVRFTWADASILTTPPASSAIMPLIATHQRALFSNSILEKDHTWRRGSADDWAFFRQLSAPSFGSAFGLYEVTSHHNLASRRAWAFQQTLNREGFGTSLADDSNVALSIDIKQDALAKPIPDASDIVVKSHPHPRSHAFFADSDNQVSIVSDTPGECRMEASGPGHIVLSEAYYPGWRVEIDGKRSDLLNYRDIFMAAQVGPGHHRVSFRYRPLSVIIGTTITLLTLVVLFALR